MTTDFDLDKATREELRQAVVGLSLELEQALQKIARLEKRVAELEKQLKKQKGSSATPFSTGARKPNPKRPGRKPGEGRFEHRQAPAEEAITETISVPLEETHCPCCGAALEMRVELATITDIPEVIKPIIRGFYQEVGTCGQCGHTVRASHPELAPDQHGASAHRLGPRVKAFGLTLHYHYGLPLRKVPGVINEAFGIELTQSALTQEALKLAGAEGAVGEEYEQLKDEIEQAKAVNTDDTGWKVGGKTAYLMTFSTPQIAVYQIRAHHRNQEVREVLTKAFDGTMITDRFSSYDAKCFEGTAQQKCLAHIQRNLSKVEAQKTGRARGFTQDLKALFKTGLELWHRHRAGQLSREAYRKQGEKLKKRLDHQLRKRPLRDEDNARLRRELSRHHQRGNLLRFLDDPDIEPTNNRAERMLRPAVIARKVSQCSKNDRGAHTYAAFKSVLTTYALRAGSSVSTQLRELIGGNRDGPSTQAS